MTKMTLSKKAREKCETILEKKKLKALTQAAESITILHCEHEYIQTSNNQSTEWLFEQLTSTAWHIPNHYYKHTSYYIITKQLSETKAKPLLTEFEILSDVEYTLCS